jgi:hypothetical protein
MSIDLPRQTDCIDETQFSDMRHRWTGPRSYSDAWVFWMEQSGFVHGQSPPFDRDNHPISSTEAKSRLVASAILECVIRVVVI